MLRLLRNSNTQIYEWFASPVVYVDDGFSERIRPLLDDCFSPKTGVYHYLHQYDLKMGQARKLEEPKVKHYLYSLQHIAAARWILEKQLPVRLDYREVTDIYPEQIRALAREILTRKTTRHDQPFMQRHAALEDWLQAERDRIQQLAGRLPGQRNSGWEQLDRFFLSELARLEEKK
jgi:predicted nucleotidyltransferase